MTKRISGFRLAAVAVCFCCSSVCHAGLMLQAIPNVTSLNVGETLTVDVVLSGLEPGQSLGGLGATLEWNGSVLGAPTITDGVIVPEPSFVLTPSPSPGEADYSYLDLTLGAFPITSNGTFFSFTATALSVGSDTMAITFAAASDAFLFPIGVEFDRAGFNYTVTGSSAVIPEPASFGMWITAVLIGGVGAGRSRRRLISRST